MARRSPILVSGHGRCATPNVRRNVCNRPRSGGGSWIDVCGSVVHVDRSPCLVARVERGSASVTSSGGPAKGGQIRLPIGRIRLHVPLTAASLAGGTGKRSQLRYPPASGSDDAIRTASRHCRNGDREPARTARRGSTAGRVKGGNVRSRTVPPIWEESPSPNIRLVPSVRLVSWDTTDAPKSDHRDGTARRASGRSESRQRSNPFVSRSLRSGQRTGLRHGAFISRTVAPAYLGVAAQDPGPAWQAVPGIVRNRRNVPWLSGRSLPKRPREAADTGSEHLARPQVSAACGRSKDWEGATMEPLKVRLSGEYWDSYLYNDNLLLLTRDGTLEVCRWDRLLDDIDLQSQELRVPFRHLLGRGRAWYSPPVQELIHCDPFPE